MKKILYILLIGLFSSCDSLLDVEPETLVSFDNFYKNEQDLEELPANVRAKMHFIPVKHMDEVLKIALED